MSDETRPSSNTSRGGAATPAEQVDRGLARQLHDAEVLIGNLRNGRMADAGALKALADLRARLATAEQERDDALRMLMRFHVWSTIGGHVGQLALDVAKFFKDRTTPPIQEGDPR